MPEPQAKSSPHNEPDPTYGVVATVAIAGLVTALVLWLAAGLLNKFIPVEQCGPENPCNPGLRCDMAAGKCYVPPPELMVCRTGDPEGSCFCPSPRAWIDGTCQYRPPPPAECDEEISELLRELLAAQKSCKERLHADATSCAPGDIREFMLKHQQFNTILNKFSATSWVLFPEGKPPLQGRWPTRKAESAHYAAGLKYDEALLEKASYILILAHAPNDNDTKNDVRMQKRLEHGFRLIQDLAGEDVEKRIRWQRKFLAFPIPPDEPVQIDDFVKAKYANIVTWDDESQVYYGKMLEALRGGGQIGAREWGELDKALNLSVTIVPIQCAAPPPDAKR